MQNNRIHDSILRALVALVAFIALPALLATAPLIGCIVPTETPTEAGAFGRIGELTSASDGTDDAAPDTSSVPHTQGVAEPGFSVEAGTVGISFTPFPTGATRSLSVQVAPGEYVLARSWPGAGNADLVVYQGALDLKWSTRPSGFVDLVTGKNVGNAPVVVTALVWCASGPCSPALELTTGTTGAFLPTPDPYASQLAVTVKTGKCSDGAKIVTDGWCRCAPTSAAMAMAGRGKIKNTTEAITAAADDLFTTNNGDGGANRQALMKKLVASYGFTACSEKWSAVDARAEIVQGSLVLARGKMTSAGHYVDVWGTSGATFAVNDPYGLFGGKVDSYQKNTDADATKGRDRRYDFVGVADVSFIVCTTRAASPCANRSGDYCGSGLPGYTGAGSDLVTCKNGEIVKTASCASCTREPEGTNDHCAAAPQATCAHSTCVTGSKLSATCHKAVASQCSADPFCCNTAWDTQCASWAKAHGCAN